MGETDLAYLAGLIDGDGSIGILRHSSKTKAASGRLYHPYIQVAGINEASFRWVKETFGGILSSNYPPSLRDKGYQRQFSVRWEWRTAYRLARRILPYLREKRNRALLIIEWYESGAARIGAQGRWHRDEYLAKQRGIWERMKTLQSKKGSHKRRP